MILTRLFAVRRKFFDYSLLWMFSGVAEVGHLVFSEVRLRHLPGSPLLPGEGLGVRVLASRVILQRPYSGLNSPKKKLLAQKLSYLHLNPVRAGLVQLPTEWHWSSARWYVEGRTVGIPIQWVD